MTKFGQKKIGNVLSQVKRKVILDDATTYNLLGVRWYGKGVFVREIKKGKEIKAKILYRVKAGDFIYNRLFAWKASFALIPKEFDGCLVSSEFPVFECNSGTDSRFVLTYILLPSNIHTVNQLSKGVSGISRNRFKEHLFLNMPLPDIPYAEQLRICNQIDKQSERICKLDSENQRQKTILSQLRQAILQEAIQGKLTADWRKENPDVEPASELLKRVAAEKAELVKTKKIRKQKTLPPITDDDLSAGKAGIPFDIPETWQWCYLSSTSFNHDAERIPIPQAERIRRSGPYDYYGASVPIDKIDGYTHDGDYLLIGEDGANLVNRSTPIAFHVHGKVWVNNHAHVLGFLSDTEREYHGIHLNAIDLTPYVTGGFQPKLSQANLNRILIALPPLDEQQVIVERVQAKLALCDKLEAEITATELHTEHLSTAILQEVFDNHHSGVC